MNEKLSIVEKAVAKADAFVNWATGMGGCEDFSNATVVVRKRFLQRGELQQTYKDNALAGRIINRPAEDAIREGFTITGTDESVDFAVVSSDMEDLGFHVALLNSLKWSRLHGGALLIPLVNDGQPMDTPLSVEQIKKFNGFRVVDRWRANVAPEALTEGSGVDFTDPEFYWLSTDQRLPDGTVLQGKIHRSRVIRFDGYALPTDLFQDNGYWGMSILEPGWEDLKRLSTVRQYMEDGAHSITGMVLKIDGLRTTLKGAGKDSQGVSTVEKMRQGIQKLRNNWNNLHWLALDGKDSIEQSNKSATGLKELEQIFIDALVMDYDIPRELLVHELKGALTTGESAGSIRLYYDAIAAMQRADLTPVVNRVLELYFAAKKQTVEQWTVAWNPLWQQTETEKAAIRKSDADTDKLYWDMGALESEEIRQARFIEGQTGMIEISDEMLAMQAEIEARKEEETEAAAAMQAAMLAAAEAKEENEGEGVGVGEDTGDADEDDEDGDDETA